MHNITLVSGVHLSDSTRLSVMWCSPQEQDIVCLYASTTATEQSIIRDALKSSAAWADPHSPSRGISFWLFRCSSSLGVFNSGSGGAFLLNMFCIFLEGPPPSLASPESAGFVHTLGVLKIYPSLPTKVSCIHDLFCYCTVSWTRVSLL